MRELHGELIHISLLRLAPASRVRLQRRGAQSLAALELEAPRSLISMQGEGVHLPEEVAEEAAIDAFCEAAAAETWPEDVWPPKLAYPTYLLSVVFFICFLFLVCY